MPFHLRSLWKWWKSCNIFSFLGLKKRYTPDPWLLQISVVRFSKTSPNNQLKRFSLHKWRNTFTHSFFVSNDLSAADLAHADFCQTWKMHEPRTGHIWMYISGTKHCRHWKGVLGSHIDYEKYIVFCLNFLSFIAN